MSKKFAWSYTALTGYESCPKQHYHLKVKKDIREAPSAAMLEGQAAHKALEERVRDLKPLPKKYSQYEKLCKKFDATDGDVLVEQKLALDQDLNPTEFFARDVWLRGVLDVGVLKGKIGKVFDWKTGKRKPDNEQMKLFAAITFATYKTLEVVDTTFVWLKDKTTDKQRFTKDDEQIIWREFEPRVETMNEAYETGYFPPRPSGLCRGWCPVHDCKHWEPRN